MWAGNRQKRFLAPPYVKKNVNFFFNLRDPFTPLRLFFIFFGTLKNLDTFPLSQHSKWAFVKNPDLFGKNQTQSGPLFLAKRSGSKPRSGNPDPVGFCADVFTVEIALGRP